MNFFYCSTRASTLVSAMTLPTQPTLQKFPFLFIFIIPCLDPQKCGSCSRKDQNHTKFSLSSQRKKLEYGTRPPTLRSLSTLPTKNDYPPKIMLGVNPPPLYDGHLGSVQPGLQEGNANECSITLSK